MKTVELCSLPSIQFAHMYQSDRYDNVIMPRPNSMEITYVEEGSLTSTRDGTTITSNKGDILCNLFKNEVAVHARQFHRHYSIGISVQWQTQPDNPNGLLLPRITRSDSKTEPIREMIKQLVFDHSVYNASPTKAAAKVLKLLCRIDEYHRQHGEFKLTNESIYTQKAKQYVQQHLYEPLVQSHIAEELGISSGYLCKVFKQTEGIPLMQYINRQKLRGIKEVMTRENVCLYEAAEMFGYRDPNYVSRLYKQLFGYNITDTAYLAGRS